MRYIIGNLFFLFIFLGRELSERQRAILEEFAEEEINNENSTSSGGNW